MLKKIQFLLFFLLFLTVLFGCDGSTDLTVKFHIDGEETIVSVKAENGVIIMPDNPELDGFVFDGWYLDDGTFQMKFDPEMLKGLLKSWGATRP